MRHRVYRALLLCYPPRFRERFGPELLTAFDAGWRNARTRGTTASVRFLLSSLVDAIVNGCRERRSSQANFLDWGERTTAFASMGALRPYTATVITAGGEAVRADGRLVLGDAFAALGLDPVAGRLFVDGDEAPGRDVVILSHRFWLTHFAADQGIIGRSVMIDERPRTVVGVLEPVLRVPGGGLMSLSDGSARRAG